MNEKYVTSTWAVWLSFILLSLVAIGQDPFAEITMKPKVETEILNVDNLPRELQSKVVSLPLSDIVRAPRALKEMKLVKSIVALPHTKEGDVVYDLTPWFKVINQEGNNRNQWVYNM